MELLTLQTVNVWENMPIENKTKVMLYDELVEQFLIEMGELLEEAKEEFMKWHFKQTRKYISTLDVRYEHIQQLEEKDKEEEDT